MSASLDMEPGALAPELRDLSDQLEAIRRDAQALVEGLRSDQLAWRPAPGRWSIAECLEHLNRTAETMMPGIDAAIAEARAHGLTRRAPYRPGIIERFVLKGTEPPPKAKMKAVKTLAPATDFDPMAAVARFFDFQDELGRRIAACNDVDLARVKVPSPVASWLRYRLGFAFHFFLAHERRHLWQARQVRRAEGFPE